MTIANIFIVYKFVMAQLRMRLGGSECTSQALSKSATRGTAMLLTVSFSFLIQTAPALILELKYGFENVPHHIGAIINSL